MSTTQAPIILLLPDWVQQHLTTLYAAKTDDDFNRAFDAFVAQEPGTIVVNGKHLDRAQYKKQIWSDKFLEAGAQVQYLGAVSVPKNQSEPIQVRFPLF